MWYAFEEPCNITHSVHFHAEIDIKTFRLKNVSHLEAATLTCLELQQKIYQLKKQECYDGPVMLT